MSRAKSQKLEALKSLIKGGGLIYSIATALRGPDSRNLALKRLFTFPIREKVGVDCPVELSVEDVVNAIETASWVDMHYLEHVESAIVALWFYGAMEYDEYHLLSRLCIGIKKLLNIEVASRDDEAVREFDEAMEILQDAFKHEAGRLMKG